MAGPEYSAAASPVRTKRPVPMITPMPKTVRSRGPNDLLSLNSGSSVSRTDCSTDLVLMIPNLLPFPASNWRRHRPYNLGTIVEARSRQCFGGGVGMEKGPLCYWPAAGEALEGAALFWPAAGEAVLPPSAPCPAAGEAGPLPPPPCGGGGGR